jgi:hypothetical protein
MRLFSFANEEITMLQCYVLTCVRSVTAFMSLPRSQRPGQRPRSPRPKNGPEVDKKTTKKSDGGNVCKLILTDANSNLEREAKIQS